MPVISWAQFTPPNGMKAVETLYGKFSYTEQSGGNVTITDSFEKDNIVTVKNACGTGLNVQLHRLIVPAFEYCLGEAMRRCPKYKVRMLGGFCPRHMQHNPKLPLSIHSWGAAFDINWDKNPMGSKLITDLPSDFRAAFDEQGWDWGGAWRSPKDAMHWQFAVGC